MATAARRGARSAAPAQSSGYRGAAGMRKMQEEHAKLEAAREASKANMNMPFRFFCPVGESRQLVVVDEAPDFFRYEHNLQNPRTGRWDIFTACIQDDANCPVCKVSRDRQAYFAMYLTVIDLTPYTNSNDEEVEWSKKLLVVKPAQQKKFSRLLERQGKGSMRGMVLEMTRDGEKDAAIGNEIEFVEMMSEDELLTFETTYRDKDNNEHVVIGHEVYDYEQLFPMQTEQQLRALVGGRPEPGSRDDDDEELGRRGSRTRGRGGDDGWPEQEERTTRRPARGAARRDDAEEEQDETDDDTPPTRPARTAVRRTAEGVTQRTAPARRTRAAPAEEADTEAEEEPAPPQRNRMAMRRGGAAAPATPPARSGGVNMAERRRALRR